MSSDKASADQHWCWICHEDEIGMVEACACVGTFQYAHTFCLVEQSRHVPTCRFCGNDYNVPSDSLGAATNPGIDDAIASNEIHQEMARVTVGDFQGLYSSIIATLMHDDRIRRTPASGAISNLGPQGLASFDRGVRGHSEARYAPDGTLRSLRYVSDPESLPRILTIDRPEQAPSTRPDLGVREASGGDRPVNPTRRPDPDNLPFPQPESSPFPMPDLDAEWDEFVGQFAELMRSPSSVEPGHPAPRTDPPSQLADRFVRRRVSRHAARMALSAATRRQFQY